ncbi:SH3 domain-containing protein [Streptococcus sp. 10F2]
MENVNSSKKTSQTQTNSAVPTTVGTSSQKDLPSSGSYVFQEKANVQNAPDSAGANTPTALAPQGIYTFSKTIGVKNEARVASPDIATYKPGQSVRYDRVLTADNHRWISYISYSGTRRYVAIGGVTEAKKPVISKVEVEKTNTTTNVSSTSKDVSTSKPSRVVENAKASKKTSQTQTNSAVPITVGTSSQKDLPSSGSYVFQEKANVQNAPELSSPVLATYNKGQSVKYDSIVSNENRLWLSYISRTGVRRYVALPVQKTSVPTTVSTSAGANTATALAPQGTYTFSKIAGVKNEARIASPDIATYKPGQSVSYDLVLTADNHRWISYISYSKVRRYVAVEELTQPSQSVTSEVKVGTTGTNSQTTAGVAIPLRYHKTVNGKTFTLVGGFEPTINKLKELVQAIRSLEVQGYNMGFSMIDVVTKKGIEYRADQTYYSASTIKGPFVASLASMNPRSMSQSKATMLAVLTQSSNEGYKQLRTIYGASSIYNWAREARLSEGKVQALYPYLTPRDLMGLWNQNYKYFTNSAQGHEVATWFEKPNLSPIKSVLGSHYKTFSKAGWIGGWGYHAANDAGIVRTPKGDYIVSIMSNADGKLGLLNPVVRALNEIHKQI